MNRYQEALEKICNRVLCGGECLGDKPCSLLEPIQEAIDKANKYDEKETPKKVKVFKENDKVVGKIESYRCPTCSYHELFIKFTDINMVGKYKSNYCEVCGQKLDWSDE